MTNREALRALEAILAASGEKNGNGERRETPAEQLDACLDAVSHGCGHPTHEAAGRAIREFLAATEPFEALADERVRAAVLDVAVAEALHVSDEGPSEGLAALCRGRNVARMITRRRGGCKGAGGLLAARGGGFCG